jgi:hypothetical protein
MFYPDCLELQRGAVSLAPTLGCHCTARIHYTVGSHTVVVVVGDCNTVVEHCTTRQIATDQTAELGRID